MEPLDPVAADKWERMKLLTATLFATSFLAGCASGNTGTVSVLNSAAEPLSRVTLKMSWGETLELVNLDPQEIAEGSYRVREGDYRIEAVFRSGKHLETDGGYVTPGFDYEDQITVTSSEIRLTHEVVTGQ